MWKQVVLGLGLLVYVAPARADDIYRWTDARGGVHFSNTPTGGEPTRVPTDGAAPASPTEAAGQPDYDAGSFSTGASLRRNALERDVRTTGRRLRELDGQLATLARLRTTNSHGSAATGGVAADASGFLTDQERTLAEEREQVVKRAADLQDQYAKLRNEVTTRFGATPEWWVDVRPERR
jgi:hypothetical protein